MTAGALTPAQLAAFHRDGFLAIRGALAPATVQALLAETRALLAGARLAAHPRTTFATGAAHVGDAYFLTSGDQVRCFFEEGAVAPATGAPGAPPERAVNKIGHGLHMRSPPFARLLEGDAAAEVVVRPPAVTRSLGFQDPRCLQSMIICKPPETGGAVPSHQDSTFLFTDPPSAVGFWYALEDATLQNGCLRVLPGSHKWAPISKRLVRRAGNAGTEMVANSGSQFPPGGAYGEQPGAGARDEEEDYVPVPARAGDLVLLHGNLLHKSDRNLGRTGRVIYTFHCIEGEDAGAVYDARNWLQPTAEGFTRLSSS